MAAAALRWLRPASNDPPTCQGRAQNAQTPAATTQTLTRTPQWQSCESRGMQAQFAFFSSRGRQGERGGSEHTSASIVAESSGIAELVVGADYRRDRCPAPDTREKHRSELCCQKGCALLCSGKICGRFQCADNVWIYHGTPRMWMNVSGPGSQAVLGLPCGRQRRSAQFISQKS